MWTPIFVAAIFAFLISHSFISVYEMVIDSLFICFCEDCEMNDGLEKPYFMSRSLMEFVENSKKALRARAGRNRDKRSEQQPKLAYDNSAINTGDEVIWISQQGQQYARPTAPPKNFK